MRIPRSSPSGSERGGRATWMPAPSRASGRGPVTRTAKAPSRTSRGEGERGHNGSFQLREPPSRQGPPTDPQQTTNRETPPRPVGPLLATNRPPGPGDGGPDAQAHAGPLWASTWAVGDPLVICWGRAGSDWPSLAAVDPRQEMADPSDGDADLWRLARRSTPDRPGAPGEGRRPPGPVTLGREARPNATRPQLPDPPPAPPRREAYPGEPSAGLRTTFRSWAPRKESWARAVPVGRRGSRLRWHTALGPTTEEAALAATAAFRPQQ